MYMFMLLMAVVPQSLIAIDVYAKSVYSHSYDCFTTGKQRACAKLPQLPTALAEGVTCALLRVLYMLMLTYGAICDSAGGKASSGREYERIAPESATLRTRFCHSIVRFAATN